MADTNLVVSFSANMAKVFAEINRLPQVAQKAAQAQMGTTTRTIESGLNAQKTLYLKAQRDQVAGLQKSHREIVQSHQDKARQILRVAEDEKRNVLRAAGEKAAGLKKADAEGAKAIIRTAQDTTRQIGRDAQDRAKAQLRYASQTVSDEKRALAERLRNERDANNQRIAEAKRAKAEQDRVLASRNSDRSAARGRIGESLSTGMERAGIGVLAGFGAAGKVAADFDGAMRNVNSIAQVSERQFISLKAAVLGVASDPGIRQGPRDLAKSLYDIYSSGFKGKEALDLLRVSAKGASAGMTDTATASGAVISLLKSGIPGVKDASQGMDLLFKVVDKGRVNFPQLAGALGEVLPVAKNVGVSFQQVGAFIASATLQGQSAGLATNNLVNLLQKLQAPPAEAAKRFRELGIEFGSAALKTRGLDGLLAQIRDKTKGNADELRRLFPDQQAYNGAVVGMTQGASGLKTMLGELSDAQKVADATQRALNQQNKGASQQYDLMKKDIEVLSVKMGTTLLPIMRSVLKVVGGLTDAFNKLKPAQQENIVKWGLIGGALLLVGGKVAGLIRLFGDLKLAIAGAATAGEGAAAKGILARILGFAIPGAGGVTAAGALAIPAAAAGMGYAVARGHESMADANIDALAKKGKDRIGFLRGQIATWEKQQGPDRTASGADRTQNGLFQTYQRRIDEASREILILSKQQRSLDSRKEQIAPGVSIRGTGAITKLSETIRTPLGEASCAYFASQLLQKTGVAIGTTAGAKALRDKFVGMGGREVADKDRKPGDLAVFRGAGYGAAKFSEGGQRVGYHVGVIDENGNIRQSSGGRVSTRRFNPAATVYSMSGAGASGMGGMSGTGAGAGGLLQPADWRAEEAAKKKADREAIAAQKREAAERKRAATAWARAMIDAANGIVKATKDVYEQRAHQMNLDIARLRKAKVAEAIIERFHNETLKKIRADRERFYDKIEADRTEKTRKRLETQAKQVQDSFRLDSIARRAGTLGGGVTAVDDSGYASPMATLPTNAAGMKDAIAQANQTVTAQKKMNDLARSRALEKVGVRQNSLQTIGQGLSGLFGNAFDAILNRQKNFAQQFVQGFKSMILSLVAQWAANKAAQAIIGLIDPKAAAGMGDSTLSGLAGKRAGGTSAGGGAGILGAVGAVAGLLGGKTGAASGALGMFAPAGTGMAGIPAGVTPVFIVGAAGGGMAGMAGGPMGALGGLGGLLGKGGGLLGGLGKAMPLIGGGLMLNNVLGNPLGKVFGGVKKLFGGLFADGGTPPVGIPSLVGEKGPELIVPAEQTRVYSNRDTKALLNNGGGAGGSQYHLHVNNLNQASDAPQVMSVFADSVERRMRTRY